MSAIDRSFVQRRLERRVAAGEPSAVPEMFGLQTAAGRQRMIDALTNDYKATLGQSRGHQALFVRGAASFAPADMLREAFGDTSHLDDVPDAEVSEAMFQIIGPQS